MRATAFQVKRVTSYHKRLQQPLGLLQIRRVKSLGKPPIHRSQQVVGILVLVLGLPHAGQAGGGALTECEPSNGFENTYGSSPQLCPLLMEHAP